MLPCRVHGTLATTATGLPVVSSIATAEIDFTYYAQPSERNGDLSQRNAGKTRALN